jgi:hypothetical protein
VAVVTLALNVGAGSPGPLNGPNLTVLALIVTAVVVVGATRAQRGPTAGPTARSR